MRSSVTPSPAGPLHGLGMKTGEPFFVLEDVKRAMGMPLIECADDKAACVRLISLRDRQAGLADDLLALKRQLFVHPWKMAAVRQAMAVYACAELCCGHAVQQQGTSLRHATQGPKES